MITWDESKRSLNLKKHGIDFLEADEILDGPTVTAEDARSAYGELRIISIRKALKHETRSYLSQVSK